VAAAGAVDRTSTVDERLKQAAITQWVQDMRALTSDGLAERVSHRSCLRNDWQSERWRKQSSPTISERISPSSEAPDETIQVEVNAILPNSPHSYEVD